MEIITLRNVCSKLTERKWNEKKSSTIIIYD